MMRMEANAEDEGKERQKKYDFLMIVQPPYQPQIAYSQTHVFELLLFGVSCYMLPDLKFIDTAPMTIIANGLLNTSDQLLAVFLYYRGWKAKNTNSCFPSLQLGQPYEM